MQQHIRIIKIYKNEIRNMVDSTVLLCEINLLKHNIKACIYNLASYRALKLLYICICIYSHIYIYMCIHSHTYIKTFIFI